MNAGSGALAARSGATAWSRRVVDPALRDASRRTGSARPSVAPSRARRNAVTVRAAILGEVTDMIGIPLPEGRQLIATVKTNPQGVHTISLQCEPNAPLGLLLHWGVIRSAVSQDWQLLPPELNPPGTVVYKQKALQSPFPAFGALQLVLDPGVDAVEFCLKVETTGDWINDHGRNFRIELGGSPAGAGAAPRAPTTSKSFAPEYTLDVRMPPTPESPPPAPSHAAPPQHAAIRGSSAVNELAAGLDVLFGVAAYLRWEQMGKPRVDEDEKHRIYSDAVDHITQRLNSGESVEALETEFGVPPGLVRQTAALAAPPAAAPAQAKPTPPPGFTPPAPPKAAPAPAPSYGYDAAAAPAPVVGEATPMDIANLCEARANGAQLLWRRELNLGQANAVKLMVIEGRRTAQGMMQMIVFGRSDQGIVLHWAGLDEPAGEWKNPPHGWSSMPENSWGTGGASWETEMEALTTARGWHAATIEAPCDRDGLAFVIRTADSAHWIKDDGQDFMCFADEATTLTDVRAIVKRRKEEERARRKAEKEERRRREREQQRSSPQKLKRGGLSTTTIKEVKMPARPEVIKRKDWNHDEIKMHQGALGHAGASGNVAGGSVDNICNSEEGATRSLMHRFNIASDLIPQCKGEGEAGLVAMAVWFRFMALRQLVWNNDYNIKPREISAAQLKCTTQLAALHKDDPAMRDVTRFIMATIGRGGDGDVGQRIRDEILVVQRNNNCMGGMMEEWHQKLHNNTSPDDVPICEALLKFIAADCDISVYWDHLHANGITKERMASYDRKICGEPSFKPDQYEGLTRDLKEYLRTLKAVHSGADLDSAAENVMGYHQDACKGKEINMPPVTEVATDRMRTLLHSACGFRDLGEPLHSMEGMLEARRELWNWTRPGGADNSRLKDVIYLDLALESAVRQVVEANLSSMATRAPVDVLKMTGLALENLALSSGGNEELVICLQQWQGVVGSAMNGGNDWALQAKSVVDRVNNALGEVSQRYINALQPTAHAMGGRLGVDGHVLDIFSEEVVRGTPAAPLSQMLRALDPRLREMSNMGSWSIVSPVEAAGVIEVINDLKDVQNKTYSVPTVLVSRRVGGEEDIPPGVVGLITPDMPDVLAHTSVRARNERVLFATVFDASRMSELEGMHGQAVNCAPVGADDLRITSVDPSSLGAAPGAGAVNMSMSAPSSGVNIAKREFMGRYAVPSPEFTGAIVGGKSRNLQELRGRLPDWINLPAQVALPFCTFDAVLAHPNNGHIAQHLQGLRQELEHLDFSNQVAFQDLLGRIRACIMQMVPTPELVDEMSRAFAAERLPWPEGHLGPEGAGGSGAAAHAWAAVTGVWASKYNDRAVLSCRKAGLSHENVSMAVLCQPVVQSQYAFVLHTTNPQTGDPNEIYGEVVCGMGEALVGNFPGRALSFVARKDDLTNARVTGFPSKANGLFTDAPTLIFRSDSNGEDLEGFAGAGLYDSIQMHEAKLRPVDYSRDPIVSDETFRAQALAAIAHAANEIEQALGSPQDIEGCIAADGALYVVQTRPQV